MHELLDVHELCGPANQRMSQSHSSYRSKPVTHDHLDQNCYSVWFRPFFACPVALSWWDVLAFWLSSKLFYTSQMHFANSIQWRTDIRELPENWPLLQKFASLGYSLRYRSEIFRVSKSDLGLYCVKILLKSDEAARRQERSKFRNTFCATLYV